MKKKMTIKEMMEYFGITDKELLKDIKKQMSYTYSRRVSYKDYVIAQDENTEFNDIIILKNGKEVVHASCSRQFTDKELRDKLLNYIGE